MATGAETYAEAHQESVETGKPMFVLIGADWCGPCQELKKTVIPQIEKKGLMKRVAFVKINADQESDLAKQLGGGGSIPQLILLRKTDSGWGRRKLVGLQSADTLEKFIKEEIDLAESGASENADAKTAKTSAKEQIIKIPDPAEEKVSVRPVSVK
jgi:thioredoxin-like negative regulator of GroEL